MENEKERKIQVPPELYAPYGKPQKDTSLRDWGGFLFVALILSAMIIWGESEKVSPAFRSF